MTRYIVVAALVLCTTFAGCSASPTSTTARATCQISPATPDLTAVPTELQASRPYNTFLALAPFSRCVTDAATVRQLYTAALALPHSTGIGSCPKGFGTEYTLTFLRGTTVVRVMTLQAEGCRYLYVDPTDIRTTGDDFQIQVANALGLKQLSPYFPLTGSGTTG